jgi:hypothetical protein
MEQNSQLLSQSEPAIGDKIFAKIEWNKIQAKAPQGSKNNSLSDSTTLWLGSLNSKSGGGATTKQL